MAPRGVPWPSRGVPWPLYEEYGLEDPYYIYSYSEREREFTFAKKAALIYKVLPRNRPLYLSHLPTPYTSARKLRSQDKQLLSVPAVSIIIMQTRFRLCSTFNLQ